MDSTQRKGPGSRGPYKGRYGSRSYEERLAARMTPQPPCKCGCGVPVEWNTSKCHWRKYVDGHYRVDHPYKDEAWLREQYLDRGRSAEEIAREFGVWGTAVLRYMKRFGIERRNMSEAHIGLQAGPNNPAWKGGVAQWEYAPDWKRIAREIRNRDEWTCQECGEQRVRWGHSLHVHHKDENKFNNDPGNLVSLCASCHRDAHRKGVV